MDTYQLPSALIFAITDKNSSVAGEGIRLLHASLISRGIHFFSLLNNTDMSSIEALDNQYRELRLCSIESIEKPSGKSTKGTLLTQLLKKELIDKLWYIP